MEKLIGKKLLMRKLIKLIKVKANIQNKTAQWLISFKAKDCNHLLLTIQPLHLLLRLDQNLQFIL